MIYLDSSVALAHLLDEGRRPKADFWREQLVSSRLLSYELWNRINAHGLTRSHGDAIATMVERVQFVEMARHILARALEPFPVHVRTLDALHLASVDHLRGRGVEIVLASYDDRLNAAAASLNIPRYRF